MDTCTQSPSDAAGVLETTMQSPDTNFTAGNDPSAPNRVRYHPTLAGGMSEARIAQRNVHFAKMDNLITSTEEASRAQFIEESNAPTPPVAPNFIDRLSNELLIMIITEDSEVILPLRFVNPRLTDFFSTSTLITHSAWYLTDSIR